MKGRFHEVGSRHQESDPSQFSHEGKDLKTVEGIQELLFMGLSECPGL